MENWQKMELIREQLSDNQILDELVQYMSSDELEWFCEHLVDSYDLDLNDRCLGEDEE